MTKPRSKSKASKPPKEPLAPLVVYPIEGEFFRFHVGSRSSPGKRYLVDLQPWNWNGQCGCMHFSTRMEKELRRGAAACDALECQHIKRAWRHFRSEILPLLKHYLEKKQSVPAIISEEDVASWERDM